MPPSELPRLSDTANRTCTTCGMLLDDAGEFHPYTFCVLKLSGRDPWTDIAWVVEQLGLGNLPDRPPLVRDLRKDSPDA